MYLHMDAATKISNKLSQAQRHCKEFAVVENGWIPAKAYGKYDFGDRFVAQVP
jgi:hypothetical protein